MTPGGIASGRIAQLISTDTTINSLKVKKKSLMYIRLKQRNDIIQLETFMNWIRQNLMVEMSENRDIKSHKYSRGTQVAVVQNMKNQIF